MPSQAPKLRNLSGSRTSRVSRSAPAPVIPLAQAANSDHAWMNASSLPGFGFHLPVV
jgi:hypothetical protein